MTFTAAIAASDSIKALIWSHATHTLNGDVHALAHAHIHATITPTRLFPPTLTLMKVYFVFHFLVDGDGCCSVEVVAH